MKKTATEEAASVLRDGGVVLVPTETVVGLVAAQAGILNSIKGSDSGKPIALLCASAEEAFSLAVDVPPVARELAETYWPGPLTLVLDLPTGETIGLRVPAGRAVRELLEAHGGPLYATSANLSGEPARAALEEVDPRVLGAVDIVVAGEEGSGEASAVVDLSGGTVRLLRAGDELTPERLVQLARE